MSIFNGTKSSKSLIKKIEILFHCLFDSVLSWYSEHNKKISFFFIHSLISLKLIIEFRSFFLISLDLSSLCCIRNISFIKDYLAEFFLYTFEGLKTKSPWNTCSLYMSIWDSQSLCFFIKIIIDYFLDCIKCKRKIFYNRNLVVRSDFE